MNRNLVPLAPLFLAFVFSVTSLGLVADDVSSYVQVEKQLSSAQFASYLGVDLHGLDGSEIAVLVVAVLSTITTIAIGALTLMSLLYHPTKDFSRRARRYAFVLAALTLLWLVVMAVFTYIVSKKMFSLTKGENFEALNLSLLETLSSALTDGEIKISSTGEAAMTPSILSTLDAVKRDSNSSSDDQFFTMVNKLLSTKTYMDIGAFNRVVGVGWTTVVLTAVTAGAYFFIPAKYTSVRLSSGSSGKGGWADRLRQSVAPETSEMTDVESARP